MFNKLTSMAAFAAIVIIALFFTAGCSKKTDEEKAGYNTNTSTEMTTVDASDYTETDADLYNVDYKQFYDDLAPNGEWIQVSGKDIGIALNNLSSGKNLTFYDYLSGVTPAFADVDAGAFFVWKPAPGLAVSLNTGTEGTPTAAAYVPYANGQWINTDQGWYFKAVTPAEEITSHYGRWVMTPNLGWVWMPGRVWAPAWVDWRENPDYVAWTPIPPQVYIVNNTISVPPIDDDSRYVVVEKRYFVEPSFYKYSYKENKNKIMIKEMTKTNGIMVMNKTIINKGPEVTEIEKVTNRKIEVVKITRVNTRSDVKITPTAISIYTPEFKRVKSESKTVITKPKTFVTIDKVNIKEKGGEKNEEKEMKKENKEYEKEQKKQNKNDEKIIKRDNDKEMKNRDKNKKLGDDSEMHKKNNDKEKEHKENKEHYKDHGNDKGRGNKK